MYRPKVPPFLLRCMVSRGSRCNRCKQVPAAEGDTWCNACTSWEAAGRELAASWDSPGCRLVAADLLLNTTRQIRALRSLGAGLARAEPSSPPVAGPPAGSRRAEDEPRGSGRGRSKSDRRRSLPRKRPKPQITLEAKREESEGDYYTEEEDSEQEEEPPPLDPAHKPVRGDPKQPPPEPDLPPVSKEEKSSRAGHHRASDRDRQSNKKDRDRRRDRRSGKKR